jgi:hypothetical protein
MDEISVTTDRQRAFPATQQLAPGRVTRYTFFMLVKTTARWLQAPAQERMAFLQTDVTPLLKRWPDVSLRYYDSEFFTTRCTDVIVWETENIASYQALIEKLRDTLFWDTYFEVVEIIPAIEDAYADFNEAPLINPAA